MTYITLSNEDFDGMSTMMLDRPILDVDTAIKRALWPREPRFKDGGMWCPSCGRRVFNSDCDAFCGHCGQRIEWR